jgi:hypothetical protein
MADVAEGMSNKRQETSSQAQALAGILAWSNDCQKWQRDAATPSVYEKMIWTMRTSTS